ncbi:hypothetical protein [Corynebacterium glyciniphilum]|uniref:hypothetical protein n=1 Tax=Corynebacterium glyciniphilum TaxID=1404244 RepID=UPI00264AA3CA|nr:hypothetical protein [Corynebacterium glyciniphilum]MDN6706396.1 hypothetical protein [Corynebacterium glyciniphilum]
MKNLIPRDWQEWALLAVVLVNLVASIGAVAAHEWWKALDSAVIAALVMSVIGLRRAHEATYRDYWSVRGWVDALYARDGMCVDWDKVLRRSRR